MFKEFYYYYYYYYTISLLFSRSYTYIWKHTIKGELYPKNELFLNKS